jgi:hypothetical protein
MRHYAFAGGHTVARAKQARFAKISVQFDF